MMKRYQAIAMLVMAGAVACGASAQNVGGSLSGTGDAANFSPLPMISPTGPISDTAGPTNANAAYTSHYLPIGMMHGANVAGSDTQLVSATTDATDMLTFAVPGLGGQQGFVEIRFGLTGEIEINTNGTPDPANHAKWDVNITINLGTGADGYATSDNTQTSPTGAGINDFQTAWLPVTFGDSETFLLTMLSNYQVESNGISSSITTDDLSLQWIGAGIYDQSGNNVSASATISSLSGNGYPVPEPTTLVLMGLAGVAVRRRR